MALVKCPECGQMVSDKATSCPNCGNPIKSENGLNWKTPILSFVVLLLVLGGAYSVWHLIRNNSEQNGDIEITDELSEAVHRYDMVWHFREGLSAVCKNNKWGYINSKGKEVIPCQYNGACDFSEGLACVYLEGDDLPIAFIDTKGEIKIKGYYGDIMQGQPFPLSFINGKCWVYDKNREIFYIDKQGQKVEAPNKGEDYKVEENGYKTFFENEKMGIKDSLGNVIIQPKYSFIDTFSQGVALARLDCTDGKTINGFVDKSGKDTFTEDDFEKLTAYDNQEQEEKRRIEEKQQRQTAEARLNGKEVLITMSADAHDDEFRNKHCNIGDVSNRFDQLISKRLKVADGKVLIFKYAELDYNNMSLDFVRIFVYDKNGHQRTYEAMSCGEFPIFEGEQIQTLIHLNYGRGDNHLNAVFHFKEKDRDQY